MTHLNWSSELDAVVGFLDGPGGVLHVRGGVECMPSAFVGALTAHAQAAPRGLITVVIDPHNQLTGSPLAAFRTILRSVGRDRPLRPPNNAISVSVASDVRSLFGDVNISNVTVNVGSMSESEEFATLLELTQAEIDGGRRFADLVVVFTNCHDMDYPLRKVFYFSLWEPILRQMSELGAKMIFQYSPSLMKTDTQSLPPIASDSVLLPATLDDVTDEFAELAVRLGWEENLHDGEVLARGVLETSTDVSQVYSAMARLAFRTRGDR